MIASIPPGRRVRSNDCIDGAGVVYCGCGGADRPPTDTTNAGAVMEVRIKCFLCKQVRASGLWRLEESHFGRITVRQFCLCAACGFKAHSMKRVIWNDDNSDTPMIVNKFVSCVLVKSFTTVSVKPTEIVNDAQYGAEHKKAITKFREIRKKPSTGLRIRFINDPDYIQGPEGWND